MLYLLTADTQISKLLAIRLQLKYVTNLQNRCAPEDGPVFPLYQGEGAVLCQAPQTPAGMAAAVSWLLTVFGKGPDSLFLSVGQARFLEEEQPAHPLPDNFLPGGLQDWRLLTALYEPSYGYWYPDILLSHPFQECGCLSDAGDSPDNHHPQYWQLADPSAMSVAQAASYFLSPHQILLLRSPDAASLLAGPEAGQALARWCVTAAQTLQKQAAKPGLTPAELTELEQLARDLFLSHTMTLQLKQLFLYHKLKTGSISSAGLDGFFASLADAPCRNKQEGKKAFEQLKQLIRH